MLFLSGCADVITLEPVNEGEECVAGRLDSVRVEPASVPLFAGNTAVLRAWGMFGSVGGGCGMDVILGSATWASGDANVAELISVNSDTTAVAVVFASGLGQAEIRANRGGRTGAAAVVVTEVPPVESFVSVAGGGVHNCAITAEGSMYCWGQSFTRELGDVSNLGECPVLSTPSAVPVLTAWPCDRVPVRVPTSQSFQTISAGGLHTCGVAATGSGFCWGSNVLGQLGGDTPPAGSGQAILPVSGGVTFVSIAAGADHTCGIAVGETTYCWGANALGQLGDGTSRTEFFSRNTPGPIAGGHAFQQLDAGAAHTCGVVADGTAYCWGSNEFGQLGATTSDNCRDLSNFFLDIPCSTTPAAVDAGVALSSITVSSTRSRVGHTCALSVSGTAYCWGANDFGQLGDGSRSPRVGPTAVMGDLTFRHLSAGGTHTCAVATSGDTYCWGNNESGQLGTDSEAAVVTPTLIVDDPGFDAVSSGENHTCAITTGGIGYCWGENSLGQLGTGFVGEAATPTRLAGQR